jgi:hypothetical protein
MKTISEMSVRILADGELVTVSGARHLRRLPRWPAPKSVTQSNSVGSIEVDAEGNGGYVSVSVSQSNSAS